MRHPTSTRLMAFAPLVLTLMLAACASISPPTDSTLRQTCPSLAGQTVAASEMGLPSGAATVGSARLVAAGNGLPEHCQVQGSIAARTANAEPIRFQLNLPIPWHGKALMYGGGGFNGLLTSGLTPLRDAPAGLPVPLARGYATFGTDSGHDGAAYPTDPAKFALNDEMFENFAFGSYKKVKDASTVLMQRYYQRKPAQQYYFGGSEGGREGLMLAQRFPQDFDGIVAVVPVIHWNGLFNGFINFTKPQFNGGVLSTAKTRLIANAVNSACDGLDGLADGVINNYLACPTRFNVQTLRCPGGTDAGASCLSDAQIATFNGAYAPTVLPFAVANGLTTYPGRLFGGEIQPGEGIERWISDGKIPGTDAVTTEARGVVYGVSYARNVIARDPRLDVRQFDPTTFRTRIQQVSALMDATDPDLSAFLRRGGKLIIRENTGDMAQSPLAGMQYYESVVARMGQGNVERFLRLYVSPASSHGGGAASLTTGTPVPTTADLLATLDEWVANARAPDDVLIQVRNDTAAPFRTLASRPMCRYPNYPQFVSGDGLKAENFRCAAR
ncbi:MAG: tannase/feruloyl esterase family alpha/beta hydrolase [Variovorax sp.]